MRHLLYSMLICSVLLSVSAGADEVFLRNGDRVSGTVVRLTDGKLVIASDAAGELTVDVAHIQTIATTEPVTVHLEDGTVFNRRLVAGQPGQFQIEADETLRAQTFLLTDLASINPPPRPEPKWTGSISVGATATSGNTSTMAANASINVVRRSDKDRITVGFNYAKGRQEDPGTGEKITTEDWWRGLARYDYFLSEKWYLFGNGRYEKDAIALLDRRVVVGGGGGYQWIESPRTNLSVRLGAASIFEKYDDVDNTSSSELAMQVGYDFDRQLTDTIKLIHDLNYYPTFDDFGDYYLTTSADLQARLTQNMFASFKTIFNYDATPAVGRGNTDVKYMLSVGMTF